MTIKRFAAALLGLTAAAAATSIMFANPASAGPVQITAGCRFELILVTANDLQESGKDEIFLRIGDESTNTVGFEEGDSADAGDFGSLTQTTEFIPSGGRISVQVWENDWPSADELLGGFYVTCVPGVFTRVVNGFGSNYEVNYRVIAVP